MERYMHVCVGCLPVCVSVVSRQYHSRNRFAEIDKIENKNAKALALHSVILLYAFLSENTIYDRYIFNGNNYQYQKPWIYSWLAGQNL